MTTKAMSNMKGIAAQNNVTNTKGKKSYLKLNLL